MMKTMVIYDSIFGNTEKIARAVGDALSLVSEVSVQRVNQVHLDQLKGLDLIIVGSPTRGFRPTPEIKNFLKNLPAGSLSGLRTAAFDTRVSVSEIKNGLLTILVKIFGYAAEPIAKQLLEKGGVSAGSPAGFIVNASEGPLKDGEIDRAIVWAKALMA